ncbi:MAG: GNAT family N-acetyltransferase [Bacteroidetes bacterium]|jgi:ribosomal protein S18 acetylase RimI-like enzyme|nr:GNAT family N-acetyltransferase [Bacteroidota bacterium]
MPDDITIRKATPDDANAISALITELAPFFLADSDDPEAATPFFKQVTPAAIRGYLTSGRYRYYVATDGDGLAGVVGIRDHAHLYHLVVAEHVQRQGLARRLWSTAKRAAEAAGNPGRFTVNASRYAVPVYERFGFVVTDSVQHKDGLAFVPMALGP